MNPKYLPLSFNSFGVALCFVPAPLEYFKADPRLHIISPLNASVWCENSLKWACLMMGRAGSEAGEAPVLGSAQAEVLAREHPGPQFPQLQNEVNRRTLLKLL